MNMKIRKSGKDVSYREIFLCPYEDRLLALCVKLVFGFVWLINMLVGIVLDVGYEYDIQAALIVLIMAVNIAISVKNYNIWIDFVTFAIMSLPVYSLLFEADIEAFSIMYPVLFSCATVFVLGIKYSLPINIVCLGSIIYLSLIHISEPTRRS